MKIKDKKAKYCKKHNKKDIPQSVALASYQDVSYVDHGLSQLKHLRELTDVAKAELMDAGMQNIDFSPAYQAFADQERSLHGMLVAHREMAKTLQEAGYRSVIPALDWVDDSGEPLGATNR